MDPPIFFPPQILFLCELKPHAKFYNPMITPSGRQVTGAEAAWTNSFFLDVGPHLAWNLLRFIFFISGLLSHFVFINTKLVSLNRLVVSFME